MTADGLTRRQRDCLEYLWRVGHASRKRLREHGFAERTAEALIREGWARYKPTVSRGAPVVIYEAVDRTYTVLR